MTLYLGAAFFALGAVIASFVGVLVVRRATGESVVAGRSRCDACAAPLAAHALLPIVSYLGSGGRARCCGARVSVLAPLSELLLGALFVLAYGALGMSAALPFFLLSLSALLALVEYDLMHQILPPSFLAVFALSAAFAGFLSAPSRAAFMHSALVAALMGALFLALHYGSRGRLMGFSDAPLVFALALLVGGAAIPGFAFSFWIGAVIGIFLLWGRPAGSRMGIEVPLAPFLAAGFLLAYFTSWNPFALSLLLPYLG
jgi:prepilin signal peptidase PulO-like enzyme (type II secretory pathway)